MINRSVIVQGIVADYRVPLFEEVVRRRFETKIAAGSDYFTPGIADTATGAEWRVALGNRFWFKRRVMWQRGAFLLCWWAETVVLELNPRVISSWVIAAARSMGRRRTVFWGHVGKMARSNDLLGWLRWCMLGLGDGFVAYTERERSVLIALGYRQPIWVTNNSCLRRADCIFRRGRERCSLVYVGRLIPGKKVDLLIESFALAVSAGMSSRVKLEIVGDGPERASLESMAKSRGIEPLLVFHGHLSNVADLEQVYSRAFAAASPGYVGLSVIQAMGFGVPVLVARDENHSPEVEACIEGVTARFLPSNNARQWGVEICRAFEERSKLERLGPPISQMVRDRYSYESMAGAIVGACETRLNVPIKTI